MDVGFLPGFPAAAGPVASNGPAGAGTTDAASADAFHAALAVAVGNDGPARAAATASVDSAPAAGMPKRADMPNVPGDVQNVKDDDLGQLAALAGPVVDWARSVDEPVQPALPRAGQFADPSFADPLIADSASTDPVFTDPTAAGTKNPAGAVAAAAVPGAAIRNARAAAAPGAAVASMTPSPWDGAHAIAGAAPDITGAAPNVARASETEQPATAEPMAESGKPAAAAILPALDLPGATVRAQTPNTAAHAAAAETTDIKTVPETARAASVWSSTVKNLAPVKHAPSAPPAGDTAQGILQEQQAALQNASALSGQVAAPPQQTWLSAPIAPHAFAPDAIVPDAPGLGEAVPATLAAADAVALNVAVPVAPVPLGPALNGAGPTKAAQTHAPAYGAPSSTPEGFASDFGTLHRTLYGSAPALMPRDAAPGFQAPQQGQVESLPARERGVPAASLRDAVILDALRQATFGDVQMPDAAQAHTNAATRPADTVERAIPSTVLERAFADRWSIGAEAEKTDEVAAWVGRIAVAAVNQAGTNAYSNGRGDSESRGFGRRAAADAPVLYSLAAPGAAAEVMAGRELSLDQAGALAESGAPEPTADGEPLSHAIVRSLKLQWRQGGNGEARLRLRPEHLGELTVALRVQGSGITAIVQADSPEVRAWVESHQNDLRRALEEQGLSLDALTVDPEGHPQQQQEQPQHGARQARNRHQAEAGRFEALL